MRFSYRMFAWFFIILNLQLYANNPPELRWDWSTINVDDVFFPQDFIFGTAVAEHQVSGQKNCPDSNWARCDYTKDKYGQWLIHNGEKSGSACDFWHLYPEDIERLKAMKVKSFRMSVDWSAIEPRQGEINPAAVRHYHDVIDAMRAAGIELNITLHHFTHPIWFEDLGGFENEENITHFVKFCSLMMQEFGDKVAMWSTFNEPGVYVFQSYIRAVWPPAKKGINRATIVMKHMMQAHVEAYQAMKKINSRSMIGMVHSITQFDPYNDNIVERQACWYVNLLFHDAMTTFFEKGILSVHIPVLADMEYENKLATKSLDFFGINYYSHVLIRVDSTAMGQAYRDDEIRTDMPYCIYPEGLYRAIVDVSKRIAKPQGIPIYITENGIADADDSRRALFIKRYLYALYKALQDGYDVRGYYFWSLLDNFEWTEGYGKKFGLYEVDMETKKRTLRKGAQPFIDIVAKTYASRSNDLAGAQRFTQIAV